MALTPPPHSPTAHSPTVTDPKPSSRNSLRRGLSGAIAAGVTLGLLAWSVRDLSLATLATILGKVQASWVLLGLGAYLGVFVLRAWRWGLLLATDGYAGRFRDRFDAFFVGYAANSLLPASAGEVVRAVLLNRLAKVSVQTALGSVLGEKLMDVLVVFLILATVLTHQPQIATQLPLGVMAGLIGSLVGLFWLAARFPRRVARGVGHSLSWVGLARWRSPVERSLQGVLAGLRVFSQPTRFGVAFGVSILAWCLNGVTYWAILMALGLTQPGWPGALATQSLAAFAIVLPSSPGFVGPFEASIRLGLGLYGLGVTEAMAAALLLRLLMYVLTPLLGLGLALNLGIAWGDLRQSSPAPVADHVL